MARSVLPLALANTLIISSGKEVPMATMVKPVMAAGIPSFLPMVEAPSISRLAPPIRIIKPSMKKIYSNYYYVLGAGCWVLGAR